MPNLPSDYGQQEAYYASDAYRSSLNKDGIGTTYETNIANIKKREEIEKNREEGYRDTGGLPANLRYPYAMIDSGMDFLKIQIATYTPPDVELEGLLIHLQSLHIVHLVLLDRCIFYFYPSENCMQ